MEITAAVQAAAAAGQNGRGPADKIFAYVLLAFRLPHR
jgi:hypothetical protein